MDGLKTLLVIDGQLLQTDAWDRGMGNYMLQLLHQISEQAPASVSVRLMFNKNIQTPKLRFEVLDYHCPNIFQEFAELPVPDRRGATSKKYVAALDSYIRSINQECESTIFMLSSLFMFDLFAEYPSVDCVRTMVFYDLIPLMQWKDLGGYFPPDLYMERFERIYESDKLFCISETTQRDVVTTFGLSPEKTCNINGGYTEHDLPPKKPLNLKLPERFILLPTGNLPHKNNKLLFQAFREFRKYNKDVHLVVTSAFTDRYKNELLAICSDGILFSQNVSNEELQYLYKRSEAVIFGSKYEGLGLPALDAVMYGKPVIASRIPVFAEMTDDAFYFFDVDDYMSAAEAIKRAVDRDEFSRKQEDYENVLHKYSWDKVGQAVLDNLRGISAHSKPRHRPDGHHAVQVGIVSINPGFNETASRMAERLFGRLRENVKLTYFFDGKGMKHSVMERPTFLDHLDVDVYDITRLNIPMYRQLDYMFYFIDDTSLDYMISQTAASLPGYVIADLSLSADDPRLLAVLPTAIDFERLDMKDARVLEQIEAYMRQIYQEASYNKHIAFMKSHTSLQRKRNYLKNIQTGKRNAEVQ